MNLELFGWVGSILFAICALPQAIESYKQGHSKGLTWGLLLCWFFGELFTIIYVLPKMDVPLLFNYSCNMVFLLIILYFKVFPRHSGELEYVRIY